MILFLEELYRYRFLLHELVIRDIKKKYRRSVLGVIWSVLNPLLTMSITAMVFSTLFRFEIQNYPLYLLSGQILFTFYAESTNFAMGSIIDNSALLRKIYIPKYLFPLARVISSCVNLIFTLPSLLLIVFVTGHPLSFKMISFILPLGLFFFFCLGIGLLLCTMAVFFRDIFHLYGVLISLLSYATPIFYPEKIVPVQYNFILKFNPLYYFFEAFRMSVYHCQIPSIAILIKCMGLACLALIVGLWFFKKYQNKFILYM